MMQGREPAEAAPELFLSSAKSRTAKARLWMWVGIFASLGLLAASNRAMASFGTIAMVLLLVGGAMEAVFRSVLKPGRALVTITRKFIESPGFPGKVKRYAWHDVIDVTVESIQSVPALQLHLVESPDRPDKRRFWTGVNAAKPRINLAPLSPDDQQRLIEVIGRRIAEGNPWRRSAPGQNDLAAEREFQDLLKAMAPVPWITYGVIGINVLVWGAMVAQGANPVKIPADRLLAWGANTASEVQKGEWWRMLTATFLHSGFMHLLMNMLGLAATGITVERLYGHRLFALVYLGAALTGSALSLNFAAQRTLSVGASGAVFGVAGALIVLVLKNREQLPRIFGKQTLGGIGVFVAYSLIQGFGSRGIDNAAHVGGLLGGCVLAWLLPLRLDLSRFQRQFAQRFVAALAVLLVAVAGLAELAPRTQYDVGRAITGAPALERSVKGFYVAMQMLQRELEDIKAGKLTLIESDERSRTVHAPVFRKVVRDLSDAYLLPGDPREAVVRDMRRVAELMAESLAMASVVTAGNPKPEPADPVRMAAIQKELQQITSGMGKSADAARAKQQKR